MSELEDLIAEVKEARREADERVAAQTGGVAEESRQLRISALQAELDRQKARGTIPVAVPGQVVPPPLASPPENPLFDDDPGAN